MIKGIFFDIDDTIFDFTKCSEKALKETCDFFNVTFNEYILNEYRTIDDILWKKQKLGIYTINEVLELRSNYMMEVMKIESNDMTFKDVYLDKLGETYELVDDIEHVLMELKKKGYSLYCASNGFYTMQKYRLEKANLLDYFQELFVSDKVGFEKPNRKFFEHCLHNTGYTYREVMMIGDSLLADIEGAINVGWKACYFNRKNNYNHTKSLEIKEMKELLNIIWEEI